MKPIPFLTLLILSFLLCACPHSHDDEPQIANEQTYLDETHPVDFIKIYDEIEGLVIEGGNTAETHGFKILFPEGQIDQINGAYTLNEDDLTYDAATEFHKGIVVYADNEGQFAEQGNAHIQLNTENETISINLTLRVEGNTMYAYYQGNYSH